LDAGFHASGNELVPSIKKIALIGSTGSIGRSTLDVVASHPDRLRVEVLAAHSNIELLVQQFRQFRPSIVAVADVSKETELRQLLKGEAVTIVSGEEEIIKLAGLSQVETVVNAIVGAAGLRTSLEALRNGKSLALANKESLVAGGPLFAPIVERHGGIILPIDSEHSAVWQCLMAGRKSEVRRIILTCSGGPFRTLPLDQFGTITVEQALNHPTWKMGNKITVDSATLANKGLEVIEAVALFGISPEQVSVVIHPQSIVHSMVEFVDSSIMAQMSQPDMRLPISYALFWPERVESDFGRLDLAELSKLTFEPPDFTKFPALRLAFEAAKTGGTASAVYNAANEVAVHAFVAHGIQFTQIAGCIEHALGKIPIAANPGLEQILEADRKAREVVTEMTGTYTTC
jgi:1-deoxy-D-xylulose-5-phosphate reductoisomerase